MFNLNDLCSRFCAISNITFLQPISATYNALLDLVNDTKIIAAAEIGSVMDPEQLKLYQADWVYFVVWSGDFISGGTWNSLDLLKSVYSSDYVLTLDEIQGWKNGGGTVTSTSKATTTSSTRSSTVQTSSTVRTSTTARTTSTTLSTSTSTRVSSATPSATGVAQQWAQCGGNGWTGATACASPYVCTKQVSHDAQRLYTFKITDNFSE